VLEQLKKLREITGVSMIECRRALEESRGDIEKALDFLHRQGKIKAQNKADRETKQGIIESYIHSNGKVGVLLELNCETDFVARNKKFKELAHDICMQIAAMAPLYVKPEDIPEDFLRGERKIYKEQFADSGKPTRLIEGIVEGKIKKYCEEVSLLTQPFIKDDQKTIRDIINDYILKLGENIAVKRFVRFQI